MPSHCLHDCACACERIVYVIETTEERDARMKKEREVEEVNKKKERQRKIELLKKLREEVAELERDTQI